MADPDTLVAFDVDRIKDFVFATHRPIDVTGASEKVKQLEKSQLCSLLHKICRESDGLEKLTGEGDAEWLKSWLGHYEDNVIYANGGSGLLWVKSKDAKRLARLLERLFRKETVTGSCTAVWLPDTDGKFILTTKEGFKQAVKALGMKLQQRKAEKAGEEPAEYWITDYFERCHACGIYPASSIAYIGGEQEKVCDSCSDKRGLGQEARDRGDMPRMALTLNDIVGEEGYLAVVYGDLNGAGKLLRSADNEQQVRHFSQRLWQEIRDALRGAIGKYTLEGRYQSPIVGGDDIVLFLPASRGLAVDVLQWLWDRLEERLPAIGDEVPLAGTELGTALKMSHFSFALLIAPSHLPIPFLFDYADGLLKSAKKQAYKQGGMALPPTIDFLWITGGTPLSDDPLQMREQSLCCKYTDKPSLPYQDQFRAVDRFWQTAKPYMKEDFYELGRWVDCLKERGVTRGQLKRLAMLMEFPNLWDTYMGIMYQIARSTDWQDFLQKDAGLPPTRWLDFFFEWRLWPRVEITTRLLDLAELYELRG